MEYYNKISILFIIIILLGSCEEYLDVVPESGLDDEELFGNYQSYRGFNDQLYEHMRDWHIRIGGLAATPGSVADLEQAGISKNHITQHVYGDWYDRGAQFEVGWNQSNNNPRICSPIGNAWPAIRIANLSLENIELLKNASKEEKDHILGQAYFFRAWNHFQLIRRYGGMPYFDKVFTSDMNMDIPRLTYRESTNKIIQDCEKAEDLLPHQWSDANLGRVTKAAAMSLKGIALLYDASPLMNNDPLDPTRNSYSYDLERAEEAAIALYDVIEYCDQTGIHQLHPGDSYREIFLSRDKLISQETIFWIHQNHRGLDWRGMFAAPGYAAPVSHSAPTQNAVDKYEMVNGLPYDDPESGYDPDKPYDNRDPRFYNNILYNGSQWGENAAGQDQYINSFIGGNQHHGRVDGWTSYFNRKYWAETANKWLKDYDYFMMWIHIRLSEIYLAYAEVVNELQGPDGSAPGASLTAWEAVNIIRNRVNMVDVHNKFKNQDDFRERIRNERAVELFSEHKRWFDLRRWHLLHLEEYRKVYRMRIEKLGENSYSYNREEIETYRRRYDDKHYWYPLPKDHIDMLNNLEQNPGW